LYESECHALIARFNRSQNMKGKGEREGHEFTRAEMNKKKSAASAAEGALANDQRPTPNGSSADDRRPQPALSEVEGTDCASQRDTRFPVLAAYDLCLKC